MARPRYAPGSTHLLRIKRHVRPAAADAYLAARLSLPRSWAGALLAAGCVARLGSVERVCRPDADLALVRGDCLRVSFPLDWPPHLQPRAMDLVVVYEDGELLAVDKPAGLVVHPARGHMDSRTLQNGVLFRHRHLLGRPQVCIGPAHRLDKDTSGLVIFSLTRRSYRELTRSFARREVRKEYLALVSGRPDFEEKTVSAPLGVDPGDSRRGAVVPLARGGKPARTRLQVRRRGRGGALVAAYPLSGRPHQVRLHLAHLGFPVLGDRLYGSASACNGVQRQMLHASGLELEHPVDGSRLRLRCAAPSDMLEACRRLGVDV